MYQQMIADILERNHKPGIDPRHVEGYMRLEHSTLDGLTRAQFEFEVEVGVGCIEADGVENAEQNARSFGL